jgi:hypothetical protein
MGLQLGQGTALVRDSSVGYGQEVVFNVVLHEEEVVSVNNRCVVVFVVVYEVVSVNNRCVVRVVFVVVFEVVSVDDRHVVSVVREVESDVVDVDVPDDVSDVSV